MPRIKCEMSNVKIIIELEQNDGTYTPGDNVTGSVLIRLERATKCKGRKFLSNYLISSSPK